MSPLRKYSLAAGIFYLLTFVSIPTPGLYRSVREPAFVTGPGPDTPVMVGALLNPQVFGTRITRILSESKTGSSDSERLRWCPPTSLNGISFRRTADDQIVDLAVQ